MLAAGAQGRYMGADLPPLAHGQPMIVILEVILLALSIYWWVIIAAAVMSWLVAFNVVDTRNRFVYTIVDMLYRLTEPALAPIRRLLPNLGGIDISPIILLLIIYALQRVIIVYLYPVAF